MTISREIDPAAKADIEKFERMLELYLKGELEEDRFRIFRLNNGIYGQRQGGHNQMVRVKIPYGSLQPEQLEISPWAEAAFRHLLRNPYSQRLPRKFKINFSGCATDCGQAMFNDVGVIAVMRPREDGTLEPGFRVFFAGGLGANPHAAQALEEFTPRAHLLPTTIGALRTSDHYGNRDNKLRARMKWLLDTMGVEELRERILKERKLLVASTTWAHGIPEYVREHGDEPAGISTAVDPTPMGWGTNVVFKS